MGISIVEVDNSAALPPVREDIRPRMTDLPPPSTDMVGPGDVLGISIYESGVTLFSSSGGASGASAMNVDAGVKAQELPAIRVNDDGDISVPYAGVIRVLGKTTAEIEAQIRRGLRGISQNPQVIVTRREIIGNAIIVGGEVAKPGRLVLQTNRESLTDVIALSGGYKGRANDLILRVMRRGAVNDMRLSSLLDDPSRDIRAYPGDHISLLSKPYSYSILGAAGRLEQMPFPIAQTTLAQAIAGAGGPNPNTGDPAAIFVFRYEDEGRRPVVYHINMMQPGAYFLAQNFQMEDKDMLYFGNARANQPSKMVQLISQLFTPIMTVTSAASVLSNSSN